MLLGKSRHEELKGWFDSFQGKPLITITTALAQLHEAIIEAGEDEGILTGDDFLWICVDAVEPLVSDGIKAGKQPPVYLATAAEVFTAWKRDEFRPQARHYRIKDDSITELVRWFLYTTTEPNSTLRRMAEKEPELELEPGAIAWTRRESGVLSNWETFLAAANLGFVSKGAFPDSKALSSALFHAEDALDIAETLFARGNTMFVENPDESPLMVTVVYAGDPATIPILHRAWELVSSASSTDDAIASISDWKEPEQAFIREIVSTGRGRGRRDTNTARLLADLGLSVSEEAARQMMKRRFPRSGRQDPDK